MYTFTYAQTLKHTPKLKHKRHTQLLASKETNELVHKSGKRPTTLSSLQQGTPLKNKTNWLIPEKKPQRGNKVSGCIHWSNSPYWMEPVGSQMSIPCSNCQVLGQPVLRGGTLKRRPSGQVVLAGARPTSKIPQLGPAGHEQQGSWMAHQNLLLSPSLYCLPHNRPIN